MEALLGDFADNPLILAAVIGLLILVAYAIIKKLFKIALFLVLLIAGVILWFQVTGTEMPDELKTLQKKGKQAVETIKDGMEKAGETAKDVKKGIDKLGD